MQSTRKLAAIFSSDVFGYSRLMGADEQATIDAVVALRALQRAHIERHAGRVVDATGDALLAEFSSAVQALRCACEVQRAQAAHNATLTEARRMWLRIGLNLGDVIESEGALYGDGVNIAARLQAAGEPGGVCISGAVHEQVVGKLAVGFEPAGELRFKNIDRPVAAWHVRESADGPAAKRPAGTAPASRLPQPLSSFVGRAGDLAAIDRLLQTHRLVTLVGPGGIGKTRLALQAAERAAPRHADGVWLVELAALADARLVPQAVATVLDIKPVAGSSVTQALASGLRSHRLLLVLDNCEHLLQACAELARVLLEAAPQLVVLASSREALRLTGEASYPVPALGLPQETLALPFDITSGVTAEVMANATALPESVQLFVDRAASARPGFKPTAQNWPAVLAVCRRLDGIPLAIELAAARVRALSVESIAARLNDRFHLLTHGDRAALPRQQTLRALIDWSHDLLSAPERMLLRRLAVFAGGWTLEAAEAVCADAQLDRLEVADLLGCLVDRSMVEAEPDGARYRLLQTVRQYAQERLEESGEARSARDGHLAWMLELAEAARARLSGPEQAEWLLKLDVEGDNFLAAHQWCDHAEDGAQCGLRLMFALKLYLFNRGLLGPLRRGVLDALARRGAEVRNMHRCRALQTAGQAELFSGRAAEARVHFEEALSIARELDDAGRAASILQTLGMTFSALHDRAAAQRCLQQALELAQNGGDQREHAAALNALAQWHRLDGAPETAEPLYTKALQLTRELGDHENTAVALLNLALVAIRRGTHRSATALLLEALDIAESIGSQLTGANVLAITAGAAALREDWAKAAWFRAAASAQMRLTGQQLDTADEALLAPLLARAEAAINAQAFEAGSSSGAAASYQQSLEAARDWLISR